MDTRFIDLCRLGAGILGWHWNFSVRSAGKDEILPMGMRMRSANFAGERP